MLTTNSHPAFQIPIDNQIDGKTVNVDQLIFDLLEADRPLIQVAMSHKLNLAQLIVWCDQPAVQAYLDAADKLAERRAASSAIQARHTAIMVLNEQAAAYNEAPRSRELAGKAARTLYRSTKQSDKAGSKPRRAPLRFPVIHMSSLRQGSIPSADAIPNPGRDILPSCGNPPPPRSAEPRLDPPPSTA